MTTLTDFGWTTDNQQAWNELNLSPAVPARIIADFGTSLKVAAPEIITAELSGKLAHYTSRDETPKVGDWVALHLSDHGNATIESVALRRNEIARKVTGKRTMRQVIATNVDIAFVLLALDKDFSVERLKRFLYQLSTSSVEAVIVLNKADKTDDVQAYLDQLVLLELPIITAIATENVGVDEIAARILPGKTAILLGSSGVGKSTLTNALLGREAQSTQEVRASDDTGKHTTVHRELFILPNGGILIDTPGIRELQLWGTEEELDTNYDDIAELTRRCAYSNCRHTTEAGCAINTALADGTLDEKHYSSYLLMKQELIRLAEKNSEKARLDQLHATRRSKARARDYRDD